MAECENCGDEYRLTEDGGYICRTCESRETKLALEAELKQLKEDRHLLLSALCTLEQELEAQGLQISMFDKKDRDRLQDIIDRANAELLEETTNDES